MAQSEADPKQDNVLGDFARYVESVRDVALLFGITWFVFYYILIVKFAPSIRIEDIGLLATAVFGCFIAASTVALLLLPGFLLRQTLYSARIIDEKAADKIYRAIESKDFIDSHDYFLLRLKVNMALVLTSCVFIAVCLLAHNITLTQVYLWIVQVAFVFCFTLWQVRREHLKVDTGLMLGTALSWGVVTLCLVLFVHKYS